MDYAWENQTSLKPGSRVYITTDGIIDQIGGLKQIAFGKKRLKSHHDAPANRWSSKSPHHGHVLQIPGRASAVMTSVFWFLSGLNPDTGFTES